MPVSTTMPHLLVEPLPIPLPEAVASETSEKMIQNILVPTLTAIVAGIIVLIIEYRTSWFQKHLFGLKSKSNSSGQKPPVSAPPVPEIVGKSVTPLEELPSPTADWFQIAKEVQTILEELYLQDVDEDGDYTPGIQLLEIKPTSSNKSRLWFEIATNFDVYFGYVTVEPSGRITEFKLDPA